MAYLYKGIAQTQEGKVIYRRKPHPFDGADLKRIIDKLGLPSDPQAEYKMLLAALAMLETLLKVRNSDVLTSADDLLSSLQTYIGSQERFRGFGGGAFGGAGASGTFWLPFPTSLP